jgi:hypothetical protein
VGLQPAPNDDARNKANAVMNRIGTGLLKQTKASLADDKANSKSSRRKDILTLLVRANTMEVEAERIKDEDMMARTYKIIYFGLVYWINSISEIPTFLVAGHETTRYARLAFRYLAIGIDKL